MRIDRSIGGALALAVGVSALAGACSGGAGGGFALPAGSYHWFASSVPSDTCWSGTAAFPPVNISFPVTIALPAAGSVTMTLTSSLSPIMAGKLDGAVIASQVLTTGFSTVVIGSGCHLSLATRAYGALSADAQAELGINTVITGVSLLGTASNCNAYAGGSYPGSSIPFPTLLGGSDGTCSYQENGPLSQP